MTFTDWDIIRNLLLAARWTLLLSLTAFFGGTLVTLPLMLMRLSHWRWAARFVRLYTELFQGTPLLMQLFLAFSVWRCLASMLARGQQRPWHSPYSPVHFGGYLVRQYRRFAERPVGSITLPGVEFSPNALSGDCPTSDAYRDCANRRFFGAGYQRHGAGLHHWFCRANQSGHYAEQCHLSAI